MNKKKFLTNLAVAVILAGGGRKERFLLITKEAMASGSTLMRLYNKTYKDTPSQKTGLLRLS